METKIAALIADEEFADKLKTVETVEQAIALFASEGVSITSEELNTYLTGEIGDVLAEDDLDDVSGGCAIYIGIRIIRSFRNRSSGGGGNGAFGGGGGGGVR